MQRNVSFDSKDSMQSRSFAPSRLSGSVTANGAFSLGGSCVVEVVSHTRSRGLSVYRLPHHGSITYIIPNKLR